MRKATERAAAASPATQEVPTKREYDEGMAILAFPWFELSRADQRDAISSLIGALQFHGVAKKLRSPETKGIVAGELGSLFGRLHSDNADLKPFLNLAKLVARKATDTEIWKEVLRVIASFARITPPPSVPPSFGGTPRTYNSAS